MKKAHLLNRRRAIALVGGAGATALLGKLSETAVEAATCLASPAQTEGPYFVEEDLNRSDIRTDPATGTIRPGVLLTLRLTVSQVTNTACGILPNARVEIWHCDAGGVYSDVAQNNTRGQEFLRGYQITDENGVVNFTTIYPGWYPGRAVHIHFKVRTYSGTTRLDEFTSQFYFDDSITDQVYTQAPYNARGQRDTRNNNDGIFRGSANSDRLLLAVTRTENGYLATGEIGVNLRTPVVSKAVLTSSGVVNAASYEAGVAPGAWISIFGQNLATTTRAVTVADLVNDNLPTSLGGVSVTINGQPAFVQYVSPTQINVQAPADASTGTVQVVVTNAGGASDPVTATLQPIFPGFFTSHGYIAAVRSDGTIITGVSSTVGGTTQAAKPGDAISLYGTGFGPTTPTIAPGRVLQTEAPLDNQVTITVSGISVPASFAGLSAAGLYQFNIVVPNLPAGDHEVIAQIAGRQTQPGARLKVQP
jgi:uncharacterized protein (TIGR03437 family)